MQIIFGDHVHLVKERFTVLELDTFQPTNGADAVTAWCVLENMPVEEIEITSHLVKLHQDLIEQFGKQNWNFCLAAIAKLRTRWGGEVDSFYNDLETRIQQLQHNPPDTAWTPVRLKAA